MLVTGYDIIFSLGWRAMIFSGIEQMGDSPFDTVLIHGLVRDATGGRKMSKSLGNGVDPLEVIDKYGADALRFSLAMGVSPGNDTRYSDEKVGKRPQLPPTRCGTPPRFVLMNTQTREAIDPALLQLPDQWILSRLNKGRGRGERPHGGRRLRHGRQQDLRLRVERVLRLVQSNCPRAVMMGEDEEQKRNVRSWRVCST